tara:strand:+ start:74 stop:376 length:303 start_codon:yes stop_codon:yes gene_type:complete
MKNKLLFGKVASNDCQGIRGDELRGMSFVSDTSLILYHEGFDAADTGQIVLTIDSGSMKTAIKAIVNELNHGTKAFIVLGDETTSEYLHTNITAVASTAQ